MKRRLAWVLSFTLLLNLAFSGMVYAEDNPPKFEVGTAQGWPGETGITIPVSAKNNTGIASIKLAVSYDDSRLELTGVNYNGNWGGTATAPNTAINPFYLLWLAGVGEEYNVQDSTFATLTFSIRDGATAGSASVTITYDEDDVYNKAEDNVAFAIENGGITVCGSYPVPANPTSTTLVFNGLPQAPAFGNDVDLSAMTITNEQRTDVGSYTSTVALKDKTTSRWADNSTDDIAYNWSIVATEASVLWGEEATFTYNGSPQSPDVTISKLQADTVGALPTATVTYVGSNNYNSTTAPTNVGSYTATVSNLSGNSNYKLPTDGLTKNFSIAKANQDAPAAPTSSSVSATSITLATITGGEYSKDGTAWQSSPTFTGLTPETEYSFYQRLAADANHNVSSASAEAKISTTAHTHNWSYAASGATITATCADSDGGHGETKTATITLVAPTLNTYGGTGSATATLSGSVDGVQAPAIEYYQGSTKLDEVPTGAGSYTAKITLGSATASVSYTIEKAASGVTAVPTAKTLTYTGGGQALVNAGTASGGTVQYCEGTNDTTAPTTGYSASIPEGTVAKTYYVWYKVVGDNDHNDSDATCVTVTIAKANQDAPAAPTSSSASATSITLTSITGGEYSKDGTTWQSSPTFTGLTPETEYSFYQRLAADANHNVSPASAEAKISTTAHTHNWSYAASGATITATCADSDGGHGATKTATITLVAPTLTTYGGTGNATATLSGSIDGVQDPTIEYYQGSTKLDAAPTGAGSYTARITLGSATASVSYTIAKAASSVTAAPTAKTLTYTGSGQALVNAGTASGGTVQYCEGTNDTTAPTTGYSENVPEGTVAKTYYVWYKVIGDNDHNDSDAACVSVTIAKANQDAPAAPTAASTSATSITLATITGGEYSMGGTSWQSSPTFTGLTPEMEYSFYQRLAADDNHNVSSASAEAKISTTAHTHNWSYTASGATITATCSDSDGGHGATKTATITLVAPTLTTYGGTGNATATLSGSIDGVQDPTIEYYQGSTKLDAAPTGAGSYTARITLGSATASVSYTIAKATSSVTAAPTAKTLTYTGSGQTLVNAGTASGGTVQYCEGTNDTTAPTTGYSENVPEGTVAKTYYVWYKVIGDSDHNDSDAACVSVTIAKANQDAPAAPTSSSASSTSITLATITGGEYSMGGTSWQSSPTFTGLTPETEYSFYQRLAADDNHNVSPASAEAKISTTAHTHNWSYTASGATITATCSDSDGGHGATKTATITLVAPTLTTYGGTGNATATLNGSIDGVQDPTIEYYQGSTKLDAAPTGAGSYTARITFGSATASVSYTIAKAATSVTAAPTAKTLTYTGSGQALVNAGTASGGTVQYCEGTNDTTAPTTGYSASIPEGTVAKTYYVWYKVVGDNDHNDSDAACVSVTIAKANQDAPAAPTSSSVSATSITLATITGGEYSKDGTTWQSSPTFTGLTPETEYSFYQRLAADANHNVSSASAEAKISTTAHTHNWSYAASGATITATCADSDGGHGETKTATITLVAPTLNTYGGTGSATATLSGSVDGVQAPAIEYYQGSTKLDEAPTGAGSYTAKIMLGSATASVSYTIEKADPIANAPTNLNATYGQTLANMTMSNPDGNTPGTWAWVDAGTTSVGTVGNHTFKVRFTPTDTANYNSAENVDVSVAVNKAANPATVISTATVTKGGNTFDLANNVIKNGTTGLVSYAFSGEPNGCVLNGSILTSGTNSGTVTVNVTVATDDKYEALADTAITVTITEKNTQTITAEDVTATYGDTGKSVRGSSDGNGAISYAVKEGSADYIDVNASNGALTIKKAGTATVVVTAAESETYAQATKEVAIMIGKKELTVTAKNQSIYVNGTVPTLEGANFYTVTGLVGDDTLTTPPTLTYNETPDNTKTGTYTITPSDAAASENYTLSYRTGTLTISTRSSSSSGGSTTTTVTVPVTSDTTSGSVPINASVSGTTATVTKLTDAQLTQVTENKSTSAESQNTVSIDVSGVAKDVKTAVIPAESVKAVEETGSSLQVTLTDGSVELDAAAQTAIIDAAKGTDIRVNLDAVSESSLNAAQRSALKEVEVQKVVDAYITSNGQRISDFNGGTATVSVPYTLKGGQVSIGLVVWYVADNGTRSRVPSSYDGRSVVFSVPHFSNYVIAYDAEQAKVCLKDDTCPISAFADAKPTEWYHDGVHWALENGVMNGVGDGKFAPNDTTTRAQVVTMLWRLDGSPAYVGMSEFSDVDNEQWYGPAIRWASAEGIVNGYDGKFAPNDPVTREQLVTILYRYAQYKKMDVSGSYFLSDFDDASEVSTYAVPAMRWACAEGIVTGVSHSGSLKLLPHDASVRAVVATMLWRFSK